MVIGGVKFKSRIRKKILKGTGDRTDERRWRRMLPFSDVVNAVSLVKGESWEEFVDRYGDRGRDLRYMLLVTAAR
jgi:hypothetical protein